MIDIVKVSLYFCRMQRILAEITDLKQLSSRKENRYTSFEYLLKVKIKDAACKGYVLPPRLKGRVHSLIRTYPSFCRPGIGDEIILTPHEVQGLLNPLRIEPPILAPEHARVRFRLLLHNPAGKRFDYKVILPPSGEEIRGSLTEQEEITSPILDRTGYGCHPIQAVCGPWSTRAILPIVKPGHVYSYTTDVNGDGFEERIVENEFLRFSLTPHLGARVESIWVKNSPLDFLGRTFEYDKNDYVEYGGCGEHIGDFPGDLWKAKFKEEQSGSSIILSHGWKGLQMEKKVELLPSLPVVYHTVKVKWRGKGEKDVLYWHRMAMALDDPTCASVAYIQTEERQERIRYAPPTSFWRERRDYYGLKFGAIIYSNETRKQIFCLTTDQDSLEFMGCLFRKGLYLITPYFTRKKLQSKEEIEFHYMYIFGEDFHFDSEVCFIACTTPWNEGKRYLVVIGKTQHKVDALKVKLSTGESITLLPKRFAGVGEVLFARKELHSKGRTEVRLRTAGKEHSLRVREA